MSYILYIIPYSRYTIIQYISYILYIMHYRRYTIIQYILYIIHYRRYTIIQYILYIIHYRRCTIIQYISYILYIIHNRRHTIIQYLSFYCISSDIHSTYRLFSGLNLKIFFLRDDHNTVTTTSQRLRPVCFIQLTVWIHPPTAQPYLGFCRLSLGVVLVGGVSVIAEKLAFHSTGKPLQM